MSIGKKLLAQTAGLGAALDKAKTSSGPANKSAPSQLMAFRGEMVEYEKRIAELEARGSSMLEVGAVRPNPWQPRRVFDNDDIRSLADSIAETGLIQPIVVRKSVTPGDTFRSSTLGVTPGDSLYELVAGERRLRAHKLLGLPQIKAVIIEADDADMAVMALAENVDREDLSDYEVSIAIRRAEKEFPNRTRLAEALGMPRAELYRYLAFGQLPDFVLQDLEASPRLLSRKSAEALQAGLSGHGEVAIDALRGLWPQVKNGNLDHPRLADAVISAVARGKTVRTERDIKKLFVGKEQAGSITRDASALTVKIKAAALSNQKEAKLREFVQKLLSEPD